MKPAENYILNQQEPHQSIMLYVRSVILKTLPMIEEKFKYSIPFYHHNKKPMCYLNILKDTNRVDLAFVKGVILQESFPELKNYKNRKFVRSLQINNLETVDELLLVNILNQAAILSDNSRKAWKNL